MPGTENYRKARRNASVCRTCAGTAGAIPEGKFTRIGLTLTRTRVPKLEKTQEPQRVVAPTDVDIFDARTILLDVKRRKS